MLDHVVSNVDRHGAIAGDDVHIEQELEGRCGVVRKFTSVAPLPSSLLARIVFTSKMVARFGEGSARLIGRVVGSHIWRAQMGVS